MSTSECAPQAVPKVSDGFNLPSSILATFPVRHPTGVFRLDTKAWRGVVAADEKGELMLNGKRHAGDHLDRTTAVTSQV